MAGIVCLVCRNCEQCWVCIWYVGSFKLCYEIKFTMHLRIILALYVSIVYVNFFMRGAVRTHDLYSPVHSHLDGVSGYRS